MPSPGAVKALRIAKAAAINAHSVETGVTAYVTETRTDAQSTLNTHLGEQVFGNTSSIQAVSLTGSTYVEINDVKIGGFTVEARDQTGDLVNAINDMTEKTGVYAELDTQSQLVLIAPDGRNIELNYYGDNDGLNLESLIGLKSGNEIADGAANDGTPYGGGVRLESLYTIDADFDVEVNAVLGDLAHDYSHSHRSLFFADDSTALANMSLGSSKLRNRALKTIDTALEQISSQRSFIGGIQARLESNTQTLHQKYESISAAHGRIVDADFAEEISHLTLHRIKLDALASLMQRSPDISTQLLKLLGTDKTVNVNPNSHFYAHKSSRDA